MQVASSGSLSAGFQAMPGIGKVDLEWNDQEVNYVDFLGFNLYRYRYDSVLTNRHYVSGTGYVYDTVWMPVDSIQLNDGAPTQDTLFTDFDVVPGERYYYYYKILSTSLTENSPSKTVSCVPYSSIRGDANGSFAVDVADVIAVVSHMTGQEPKPFIFDAADVNGDGVIDVLDIVGIINIILHPDEQQTAIYTIEDGILYVNTPVALGGVQFVLGASQIEVLDALKGFEIIDQTLPDGRRLFMAYSMSGREVAAGKQALLRIGNATIDDIALSDPRGHNVIALKGGEVGLYEVEGAGAQIMKAFPNPFSDEITLQYVTSNGGRTELRMRDITGRLVHATVLPQRQAGHYSYTWRAAGMPKGIYMVTLYIDDIPSHTIKVVLK